MGPTNAINDLTNPYRDRTVYNAGTDNFGGRTIDAVISPDCRRRDCDALDRQRQRRRVADRERAGRGRPRTPIAGLGVRLRDVRRTTTSPRWPSIPTTRNHKTIWAGTGEPNACGSGCEAGVGIYATEERRRHLERPAGQGQLQRRAPWAPSRSSRGTPTSIFAASGRGVRGVSNTCCGGADALIPGAPHFGLYRIAEQRPTWQLVHQGAAALCTPEHPRRGVAQPDAVLGARRAPGKIDPVDPNTVYVSYFSRGIWRSRHERRSRDLGADHGAGRARPGTTRARRVRRGRAAQRRDAHVRRRGRRSDRAQHAGLRALPPQRRRARGAGGHRGRHLAGPDQLHAEHAGLLELRLLRRAVLLRQLRLRARTTRRTPAPTTIVYLSGDNEYNENNTGPAARTAAPCCSPPTPACTSRT